MIPSVSHPHLLTRRRFGRNLSAGLALAALRPPGASAALLQAQDGAAPMHVWSPMLFGARGDGQTDDTATVQKAVDAAAAAGGGRVALDPGKTFLTSTIQLRAHVDFHLSSGSVLRCSTDRQAFHRFGSLLFAKDADDVHISGTGAIEGNDKAFFGPKGPDGYHVPQPFLGPYDPLYGEENRSPADGRPRMILLVNCRRVLLEQFTIRNSPTWTIHPVGCEDLRIAGITIQNDLDIPNCDGIDIDHCRGVRIEGCHIVAGDDCLVLKASRNFGQYGPCENIVITNCTLESSSAGIKVEPEGAYPVRSAVITDCSMVRCNRGISLLNRDGATVEDLLFQGLTIETRMRSLMWWGSGEPVAVSSVPRVKGGPAGLVRGVAFAGLLCRGESGIYLRADPQAPLRDVSLRGIDLAIGKTTAIPGGFYDMRPGDAFGASGLDRRSTAGIFAAGVSGLNLSGVRVRWGGTSPDYYGAALELHRCDDVSVAQVFGAAAHPGQPPAILEDVRFAAPVSETGAR